MPLSGRGLSGPDKPWRHGRGAGERAAEGQARGGADRARPAEREDRPAGGRPPFCPTQAQAMSRTISPVTGKPYGLAAVCRVWRLARSGVYRHLSASPPTAAQRRGARGAMSDEALTIAIRGVLSASPFHGEGHRKVWARLRHAGTRTSLRRVLRLMRQNNLLAPTWVGSPRGPRNHDGTIIPDTVDAMWGTDLTTTITGEGQAAVFVALDHCSAECVGIHAHARATRFQALESIRQGVRQHFGGFAQAIARGLAVRHDHGSQYMSDHFQKELAFLGIESSPAFVRAPEGNGCAERFIRTLKETCSGCGPSRPSRSCGRRCSRSGKPTTRPGWSSATASSRQPNFARGNFKPPPSRRRLQSGVPKTAGGTKGTTLLHGLAGWRRDLGGVRRRQFPDAWTHAMPFKAKTSCRHHIHLVA